jgi:hypothetical protein
MQNRGQRLHPGDIQRISSAVHPCTAIEGDQRPSSDAKPRLRSPVVDERQTALAELATFRPDWPTRTSRLGGLRMQPRNPFRLKLFGFRLSKMISDWVHPGLAAALTDLDVPVA